MKQKILITFVCMMFGSCLQAQPAGYQYENYTVMEKVCHGTWCEYVPRTKQRLVKIATPVSSTVSSTVVPTYQSLPIVNTQWGRINLETYNRNCNCAMCQGIRGLQQQYRNTYSTPQIVAAQAPTSEELISKALGLLQITSSDIFYDAGCGDGRVLIEAVKRYGCKGIGVEIDPAKAEEARRLVTSAGLSTEIDIVTGDVLEFDPEKHGVTAMYAYLYPETLAKLVPQFNKVRVVASLEHSVPRLNQSMAETSYNNGRIWIYTPSSLEVPFPEAPRSFTKLTSAENVLDAQQSNTLSTPTSWSQATVWGDAPIRQVFNKPIRRWFAAKPVRTLLGRFFRR